MTQTIQINTQTQKLSFLRSDGSKYCNCDIINITKNIKTISLKVLNLDKSYTNINPTTHYSISKFKTTKHHNCSCCIVNANCKTGIIRLKMCNNFNFSKRDIFIIGDMRIMTYKSKYLIISIYPQIITSYTLIT